MRDFGLILGIVVGVVLVAGLLLGPSDRAPVIAPDFTLSNLDGEPVTLASYRGQVVVLDFWATWCKPCITSFPDLHELVARYKSEGVVLLVVSIDKSLKKPREYLIEHGYSTENVLWGSLAEARAVKELFGVIGIPQTLIIDRGGYIQFKGHPTKIYDETLSSFL